jgi:hypothetical protein
LPERLDRSYFFLSWPWSGPLKKDGHLIEVQFSRTKKIGCRVSDGDLTAQQLRTGPPVVAKSLLMER